MSPENNHQSTKDSGATDLSDSETRKVRKGLTRGALVGAAVIAVILGVGVYSRLVSASDLKTWTQATDTPTVTLVKPKAESGGQSLTLPGALQAFDDANLYSRVPGYIHAWYKDIGAQVKKGEVLATIDTPELDQQISQAEADLGQAQAAQKLSQTTADRWQALLPSDAVSKQDAEEKQEDLQSKTAAVKAAQANLDRLQALKGFSRITAPFDGVVTKRTADIGTLVTGSPGAAGDPLFAVSDVHDLRVYVNVPQSYSASIVPGMTVSLTVPEYPGKTFPAKLVTTSNAISAQSSTLLVEFQVDNAAGQLKAGDYAQVAMGLPASSGDSGNLEVPASALLFRAGGLKVATLGAGNHVVLKPITVATDLGVSVIVAAGLNAGDQVINNPPDSLANGDLVRVGAGSHAG